MICDACLNWEELPEGCETAGPPVCWDCAGTRRGDLAAERYYLARDVRTSGDVLRLVMLDRMLAYEDGAAA